MVEQEFYDPTQAVTLWHVCFSTEPSNLAPWYARPFIRGPYCHVWAMRDYQGVTLIVNQAAQGLLIDISTVPVFECLKTLHDREKVLSVAGQLKPRYTQRGIQTCVSVVKSLLGIRAWHIITPNQLYTYLLKHGGAHSGKRRP